MWVRAGLSLPAFLVSCPATQLCGSRSQNPRPLALHLMSFHRIQLLLCEHWFWRMVNSHFAWNAHTHTHIDRQIHIDRHIDTQTDTHTHTQNIRTMCMQGRFAPLGAETLPSAPFCPARLETVSSRKSYRFHSVTWKLLQPAREPELTWSQGLNWIGSP